MGSSPPLHDMHAAYHAARVVYSATPPAVRSLAIRLGVPVAWWHRIPFVGWRALRWDVFDALQDRLRERFR